MSIGLEFYFILCIKDMDAELLREVQLSFIIGRRELIYVHGVFDRDFGRTLIALVRRYTKRVMLSAVLADV